MSTTDPTILNKLLQARTPRGKEKQRSINDISVSRKEELKEYKPLAKEFLSRPENQDCKIKMAGCTGKATQVHHAAGRSGKQLLNVDDFIPACTNCNLKCESEDKKARELGVKKTRLGKVKK